MSKVIVDGIFALVLLVAVAKMILLERDLNQLLRQMRKNTDKLRTIDQDVADLGFELWRKLR